MSKKPRSQFTLAFKQDAVRLITEKGDTCQQAVESLNISLSVIGRWARAEKGGKTSSASS